MNATPAFEGQDQATPNPLMTHIQELIRQHGPIPFAHYMQTALYHPVHGYYAANQQRVGQQGDFITSVSIGRCFGMILAHRLEKLWQELGKPTRFHLIEPGAHDGTLCSDILSTIQQHHPGFYHTLHYHLIETTPGMLKAQHQRLAPQHDGRFSSHLDWSALHNLNGAILSNELLDAFPVDLIRFDGSDWKQLKVDTSDTGTLELHPFALGEPDSCPLAAFCAQLGTQFPEGYTSEYNPGIETFAEQASRTLASGALITIDYGHSSEDYYHPGRSEGTLQTYHQHQKSDDPLVMPGEIDITCHVDFGRLQRGAENAGFTSASLRSQASYLTDHARDWLLSIENPDTPTDPDTPKRLRQFQSLIHPAMLGTRFSVLEMRK